MPRSPATAAPHRVAVLARHGVMPMELGLIHQLFGIASGGHGHRLYMVTTCTLEPGSVRTDADFTIGVTHGLDALESADTVLVPAAHELDETGHPLDQRSLDRLAGLPASTRIASVCTGAFVLAAAGLLDGHRATTHWISATRFRTLYPHLDLDPDVLFTDEGRVLTSAGEASGIDLCLHMIRRDHGARVAADVARRTIVPPHRDGGQAQYIPRPALGDDNAGRTATARTWALAHLDSSISLAELAAQQAVSVRTLTRAFREEVGTTPGNWLTRQRLDRAMHLLEATDHGIDHIAGAAGFGTAASLRQHMRAALGITPTSYRATFRGPRDSGP